MNSRRFMGPPPQAESRTATIPSRRTLPCTAAKLIVEWQRWVKTGKAQTEQKLSGVLAKADL